LPPGPSSVWRTNSTLVTIDIMITLSVELEQEEHGRWIAEVRELPGVLAYGKSAEDARARAQALALRVVADRLEHGEAGPDLLSISFKAA
jgi:predicted RNase H-like HicB family nuclease